MKSLKIYFILLLSIVIYACYQRQGGKIVGVVKETFLDRPFRKVAVRIPLLNKEVLTDSLGNFVFNNVPMGNYKLIIDDSIPGRRFMYYYPIEKSVRVQNDSIPLLSIYVNSRVDQSFIQDSVTFTFLKLDLKLYLGSYLHDPISIPQGPQRIIYKDTINRFLSSLDDFVGCVRISSSSKALEYVRLLTNPLYFLEHNNLGIMLYDLRIHDNNYPHALIPEWSEAIETLDELSIYARISKEDFSNYSMHNAIVTQLSDTTYLIDRFVFKPTKNIYHISEIVSQTGHYFLKQKDYIGIAKRINFPIVL